MTPMMLNIIRRAIEIRLKRGEDINTILSSYPRLSEQEKQNFLKEFK